MLRQSRRRLAFESLEDRRLLAFASEGSLIGIKGTKGDDVIRVERVIPGNYQQGYVLLTLNGEHASYSYDGTSSTISAVLVLGLGGNDQITIDDNIPFQALIDGGKGDDTITTSHGNDVVLGGAGIDTIITADGSDRVDGGAGNDTIDCGDDNDTAVGGKGNDTIHGGNGTDVIIGDAGIDALYGDDGDDALGGGKGNDLIFGGDGADILNADAGIDLCYGGDGDDLMDGGAGNDTLFGNDGNDVIAAGAGVDECHGGSGKDALFGDAGNDSLYGDDNNDHLDGGKGVDNCLGGDGDDQLKGGLGDDHLDGQSGDNLLDPDLGADSVANGIQTDLDQEYVALMPGNNGPSYVEYDLQNINGEVHTTIRIVTTGAGNLYSPTDVLIDGVKVAEVFSVFGTQTLEFSPTPLLGQSPISSDFPTIHAGSLAQIVPFQPGTFVQTYVI
jgi:Ca2+-binding RTX toxin-like protein